MSSVSAMAIEPALADAPSVSTDDILLPLDAFVRSVAVNAAIAHSLLLGAGASITSHVPSAANCVWMWKRSIFLSNNPGVEQSFAELSLGSVQDRLQTWLDQQPGFPAAGSPEEYGFYIERCYPRLEDRRAFFQAHVQRATLSSGYRLAAQLAQTGLVRSVWTTNFDGLMMRALASTSVTPVEIGLDSANRALRPERANEVHCVSLHGDYRYDALRNTEAELQELDQALRAAWVDRLRAAPTIVLGYSGRDKSIMDALAQGYSQPGAGALYWCGYGDGPPPPNVADLIALARAHGRSAHYVPGAAFDDVMRRLALAALTDSEREAAQAIISELGASTEVPTPFSVLPGPVGGLLKSTAFRLARPVEAYAFKIKDMPDRGAWQWLREQTAGRADLVAVPFKRQIWALGTLSAIQEVFGDTILEAPVRVPLDAGELRFEDGAITHLLLNALSASIAQSRGLPHDGSLIWATAGQDRTQSGARFRIHDAVLLHLRRMGRDTYLVLKPTIKVFNSDGSPASKENEKSIKLSVFGYQHNDKFNGAVEAWRRTLFGPGTIFTCPASEPSGFKFEVKRAPVSAAIVAAPGEATLPRHAADKASQRGFKVSEPHLVFGAKSGGGEVSDQHPIRGLSNNRPFDFSLTRSGLASEIRLGVICPASEAAVVAPRLRMLEEQVSPSDTERDYLLDYPGFSRAFGLPLVVPKPGDDTWKAPDEPPPAANAQSGATFAARAIVQAIDELRAAQRVNVILIITPNRWSKWRGFENDIERFDLHDFVKAYCARQGIATQFIDQETLSDSQACRIRWWLSLALYAKSFRTPFVLKGSADDTAYVGFGTSVDRFGPSGKKVVLGCSHIFNHQGQGLQYRLSKIEDPSFDRRRRNAFLSRDDARRVGETIRQLFFEARSALPRRVVIHKRTEFRREEREGLIEGLSGVETIDLVEINVDDAFRYVNSKLVGSAIEVDRFPVARGTVIPLSGHEALLWVHGSAAALRNNWRYYQGKRRVPAPLLIRRHWGNSDLTTLASEILGLSKMNWNSFDLYTQLPATIETSKEIAKIGKLMESYGEASYDYRLLM